MTLAEISALTIEDAFPELFNRVMQEGLSPEDQSDYTILDVGSDFYDDKVLFNSVYVKPPKSVFEAELVVYKAELSAVEQARLDEVARVDDIKSRFAAITDLHYAFSEASKDIPNPAVELQRIIDEDDQTFLSEIEAGWTSAQAKISQETAREAKRAAGASVGNIAKEVVEVIAGHNLSNSLSVADIDQMEADHGAIFDALNKSRPDKAKPLIEAIVPDGSRVTQDMKDDVLAVYAKYGL